MNDDFCLLCGTQSPCPEGGCIAYRKHHGLELTEEQKSLVKSQKLVEKYCQENIEEIKEKFKDIL